jgi:molybdenum cofactor cytidylyltransferase
MISALLLAAGQGRRMNYKAKALLRFQGQSFLQRALQQLSAAALDELIVVTGAYRAEIEEECHRLEIQNWVPTVRLTFNPHFSAGLLGSIQAGLRQTHPETEAALITLVDLPFLEANDYQAVVKSWREGESRHIVRSFSGGIPAHPVLIPRAYFAEICQQPPSDKGCSFLFQKYPAEVRIHELSQTHGHIDIDSLEDYHAHIAP